MQFDKLFVILFAWGNDANRKYVFVIKNNILRVQSFVWDYFDKYSKKTHIACSVTNLVTRYKAP